MNSKLEMMRLRFHLETICRKICGTVLTTGGGKCRNEDQKMQSKHILCAYYDSPPKSMIFIFLCLPAYYNKSAFLLRLCLFVALGSVNMLYWSWPVDGSIGQNWEILPEGVSLCPSHMMPWRKTWVCVCCSHRNVQSQVKTKDKLKKLNKAKI